MTLGFTPGTTGAPKGLISGHGAAVSSLKLVIRNLKIKPDRRLINASLTAIPLLGAGSGLIFPSLFSGGVLVVKGVQVRIAGAGSQPLPAGEIGALIAAQAKPHEVPHSVAILPEMPRSILGKQLRKEMRQRMKNAAGSA